MHSILPLFGTAVASLLLQAFLPDQELLALVCRPCCAAVGAKRENTFRRTILETSLSFIVCIPFCRCLGELWLACFCRPSCENRGCLHYLQAWVRGGSSKKEKTHFDKQFFTTSFSFIVCIPFFRCLVQLWLACWCRPSCETRSCLHYLQALLRGGRRTKRELAP